MPEVLPVEAEETAPELKEMATVYGECLWDWSRIEAQLFLVFIAASGLARCMTFEDTERRETLARTFFAINGMQIRVAITHALAQQRWDKSPTWLSGKESIMNWRSKEPFAGELVIELAFCLRTPIAVNRRLLSLSILGFMPI